MIDDEVSRGLEFTISDVTTLKTETLVFQNDEGKRELSNAVQ